MPAGSYLLVPVKPLHAAKSRLRSVTRGAAQAHAELVTAVVLDTVTAARRARGVREVIAVTSDPDLAAALGSTGIDVLADLPGRGGCLASSHGTLSVSTCRSATARVQCGNSSGLLHMASRRKTTMCLWMP